MSGVKNADPPDVDVDAALHVMTRHVIAKSTSLVAQNNSKGDIAKTRGVSRSVNARKGYEIFLLSRDCLSDPLTWIPSPKKIWVVRVFVTLAFDGMGVMERHCT